MAKDITSYPFSEHQLHLLNSKGFLHVDDVKELSASELSKELGVTDEDALDIIHVATNASPDSDSHKSAYDLLQEEEEATHIVTFCAALDNMIGGGIPTGKITEFCGTPGAGKTQLGIQLAVDVQIPEPFGGVGGEAVYIDCEGSFISERAVEIAEAALDHLVNVAQGEEDLQEAIKTVTMETLLSGIHVYRCHDYVQLVGLSYILPQFIQEHPKIKLIVLDSIAFHFRYDFEDMALRSRLLQGMVQRFMAMAHDNRLAVVLMNQMTTKLSQHGDGTLIPALGQIWGHACTIRILLSCTDGQRYARLLKSPSHKEATVLFDIMKDGIRDVSSPVELSNQSAENSTRMQVVPDDQLTSRLNHNKRQRIS